MLSEKAILKEIPSSVKEIKKLIANICYKHDPYMYNTHFETFYELVNKLTLEDAFHIGCSGELTEKNKEELNKLYKILYCKNEEKCKSRYTDYFHQWRKGNLIFDSDRESCLYIHSQSDSD